MPLPIGNNFRRNCIWLVKPHSSLGALIFFVGTRSEDDNVGMDDRPGLLGARIKVVRIRTEHIEMARLENCVRYVPYLFLVSVERSWLWIRSYGSVSHRNQANKDKRHMHGESGSHVSWSWNQKDGICRKNGLCRRLTSKVTWMALMPR